MPCIKPPAATAGSVLVVEFYLFGFVEVKRWVDFYKPKSQAEPGSFFGLEGAFAGTGENGYPGGIFVSTKQMHALQVVLCVRRVERQYEGAPSPSSPPMCVCASVGDLVRAIDCA